MKRNNLWKWLLVIFVVAWALRAMYPPTNRDLITEFQNQGVNQDTNFTAIVTRARVLQKEQPQRVFKDLMDAIGTNDVTRYFPAVTINDPTEATRTVLDYVQQRAAGKIRLGLDLQGGTSYLVQMDTNRASSSAFNEEKKEALNQVVEVLRRRVDRLGVAEPMIQPVGSDKVMIALPGLSDADTESAKRQIQTAAFLKFCVVHPDSQKMIEDGIPVPGYKVLTLKTRRGQNMPELRYLVKDAPEEGLTGAYVKSAGVTRQMLSNEPEIYLNFNDEGGKKFAKVTTELRPQGGRKFQLAIVLDGVLYSAPNINEPITGGRASISGDFTIEEARELANVLNNPLERPVKIIEERRVDPSLGKDSIRSGIVASAIGTSAVVIFMLVYYMFAGLVANLALCLNIVILMGVMCAVGTTLTIPGIAGIVLTIGMAVDANVLIYERIREELTAGKSMRGALVAGYDKAFNTIFDSNLTTLISSVILIYMGTGSVKGFGVTLTIGVTVSMFTALVVTRLIFDWLLDKGWLKNLPMLHLIKGNKIDFMRWARLAFVGSWTIIGIGCGYGIYRGHNVLGVDFAGGDTLALGFDVRHQVKAEDVRRTVQAVVPGESLIQYEKDLSTGRQGLRIVVPVGKGTPVLEALKKDYPQANFEVRSAEQVGASVGREIQKTAIIATLLSMFGILIYVAMRYEFSFAVGAVIALVHDVLMTMGLFCLSGRQFSAPMVAAILTIIGFSINDTIVIFDRIREDLRLGLRGTFTELMNFALNQTLSRTIITSGTVFLATASLYLFGGGVINDFAFTFLVGIVTGTYSSIYIASALVLWWHKGQRPAIGPQPATPMKSVPVRA